MSNNTVFVVQPLAEDVKKEAVHEGAKAFYWIVASDSAGVVGVVDISPDDVQEALKDKELPPIVYITEVPFFTNLR